MRYSALMLSAVLVVSLVGAAAAPVAGQQAAGEAYSGTHVEFQTTNAAVADYAVDGTTVLENVTMGSSSEAGGSAGVDLAADLESATGLAGASIGSRTEAGLSVRLGFESGGEMAVHDTSRGVVQFRAGSGDQVVNAGLSSDAEAESTGDGRVVVTKDDGSQGTFLVVGDGEAVVNEEGNVTAEVSEGSELIYRQYEDGERGDSDEEAERMIQNGTATAEVYVQGAAESGSDAAEDGQETAVEAVEYGQDTTVEVTSQSQNEVNMTVERTESQGKVVLTTLSEEAFERASDVEVFVDGEAAAEAESYSAVAQSTEDGDEPRYYVAQSSSAEAATDVAVGVDHFSERNVRMASAEEDASAATPTDESNGTDGASGADDGSTDGDGAGFGVLAALAALAVLGPALFAARRR